MTTEQVILDEIARKGFSVIVHGYRTGRKVSSYGARRFNAMIKLRDKGVVRIKAVGHYRDCRSAYSDHWSEIVVEKV